MTKRNRHFVYLIAFLALCIAACEQIEDPCLLPRTSSMGIGAYKATLTDTGINIADSVLPSPVMAVLDSPMAFVYAPPPLNNDYYVRLSPLADSTKFFILTDTLNRNNRFFYDTVTVYYTRSLQFLSTACGYTNFFSIMDVKHTFHQLDSVVILKTEVTNTANVEHIKIYY